MEGLPALSPDDRPLELPSLSYATVSKDIRKSSYEPAYKSAPIVALYWVLKRLLTYWFMSDVLPTLLKCCT